MLTWEAVNGVAPSYEDDEDVETLRMIPVAERHADEADESTEGAQ